MTEYKFDISRLTPIDWFCWGQHGYYSVGVITYLIQKTALFDLAATPEDEHSDIGYAFGLAVNEYISQFIASPPISSNEDITSKDIQELFRRITKGE